jgi:Flp pilus assembly protein TadG
MPERGKLGATHKDYGLKVKPRHDGSRVANGFVCKPDIQIFLRCCGHETMRGHPMISRFCRAKGGNFAMMLALVMPVLIAAGAFAVDIATLIRSRAELQSALDSASLASSRLGDAATSRQEAFQQYFHANIAGQPQLANAVATLDVDEKLNYIKTQARASADVRLFFPKLFGNDRHIAVEAGAVESSNTLEVVLVLDNTGSMAGNRINALRTAATALVNMLEATKSPERKVRVAIVPFVTAVNVKGDEFDSSWIDTSGLSSNNGSNFPSVNGKRVNHMDLFERLKTDWKGCVEARPGSYNISDDSPTASNADTLFVPYFAPDDPGLAQNPSGSYGNSSTDYNNSYLDDTLPGGAVDPFGKYSNSSMKLISEAGPITVGPNRACPTPIVPLTGDFDKLRTAVAGLKEWNGSGTNVSEGLAWGMRVLSPQPPYTGGAAFKTVGVTKAVLLLTDGENVVYGASKQPTKSDYSSYGYLASGRFGSDNQSAAARNVDGWTLDTCQKLKDDEVQIYTVLLQADTPANRTLYTKCASSSANYYPTNDVSQLQAVFLNIGSKISQLRLTN